MNVIRFMSAIAADNLIIYARKCPEEKSKISANNWEETTAIHELEQLMVQHTDSRQGPQRLTDSYLDSQGVSLIKVACILQSPNKKCAPYLVGVFPLKERNDCHLSSILSFSGSVFPYSLAYSCIHFFSSNHFESQE